MLDYITQVRSLSRSRLRRRSRRVELIAYRYDGFGEPMDTIKDKQHLDELATAAKPLGKCGGGRRERPVVVLGPSFAVTEQPILLTLPT